MGSGPFGTTYFTLTGFHGAHVFGGVIMLGVDPLPRHGRPVLGAAPRRGRGGVAVLALRRRRLDPALLDPVLPVAGGTRMHPMRQPAERRRHRHRLHRGRGGLRARSRAAGLPHRVGRGDDARRARRRDVAHGVRPDRRLVEGLRPARGLMEALWHSILDLLSKVVIPDWGELIALLPARARRARRSSGSRSTIRRFATVGPARRAPARLTPIAPPTSTCRGRRTRRSSPRPAPPRCSGAWSSAATRSSSAATVLVADAPLLGRARRSATTTTPRIAETLPAVVHAGPPPGVHMPGPSFRPLLGALGTTALMAGLVVGGWVLAAGAIILVVHARRLAGGRDARSTSRPRRRTGPGTSRTSRRRGWPRGLLQGAAVICRPRGPRPDRRDPARRARTAPAGPGGSPAPSGGRSARPAQRSRSSPRTSPSTRTASRSRRTRRSRSCSTNQDPPASSTTSTSGPPDKTTVIQNQEVVNGGASATYSYDALAGRRVRLHLLDPSHPADDRDAHRQVGGRPRLLGSIRAAGPSSSPSRWRPSRPR